MSEKRKDEKGRILRTGESQREDGRYMYRYIDLHGKRRCTYAKTLSELREKEKAIQRDLDDGIDYDAGEITVIELVEKYISQKAKLRDTTKKAYGSLINRLRRDSFCQHKIKSIKMSDAKSWFIKLQKAGYKKGTISQIRAILLPAFTMAVDDDMLRKNPFSFKLAGIINDDIEKKAALSKDQKSKYLEYVASGTCTRKNYNEIVIMLGTGLRVSELCGLTLNDLDFVNRKICINKQLITCDDGKYQIGPPKSDAGYRMIPMSEDVYAAFERVIENRKTPKTEWIIDGHTNFVFLTGSGKPKADCNIQAAMRRIIRNYNAEHTAKLPNITPHTLRHTFCTDCNNMGMNIKTIQYLMGHSKPDITLDTYTHSDYDSAEKDFLSCTKPPIRFVI